MTAPGRVVVVDDADALARTAEQFLRLAAAAAAARGRFTVALRSGGSTPLACTRCCRIRRLLSQDDFLGPASISSGATSAMSRRRTPSNYRMARETLISRVPLPADNVHRTGRVPDAAKAAARTTTSWPLLCALPGSFPRFDLMLSDRNPKDTRRRFFSGHEGARSPGQAGGRDWVPKWSAFRITMRPRLAARPRRPCSYLWRGQGPDSAVRLRPRKPARRPSCQLIRPESGDLVWLVTGRRRPYSPAT